MRQNLVLLKRQEKILSQYLLKFGIFQQKFSHFLLVFYHFTVHVIDFVTMYLLYYYTIVVF